MRKTTLITTMLSLTIILSACGTMPKNSPESLEVSAKWRDMHSGLNNLRKKASFNLALRLIKTVYDGPYHLSDVTLSHKPLAKDIYVDMLDVNIKYLQPSHCYNTFSEYVELTYTENDGIKCSVKSRRYEYRYTTYKHGTYSERDIFDRETKTYDYDEFEQGESRYYTADVIDLFNKNENILKIIYSDLQLLENKIADLSLDDKSIAIQYVTNQLPYRSTLLGFKNSLSEVVLTLPSDFNIYLSDLRKEKERKRLEREKERLEANRLAKIRTQQRILEKDRLRAKEEAKAKADRKYALANIPKQENIGRTICKSGPVTYQAVDAYNQVSTRTLDGGQLQAVLEGFSQSGERIKIRVSDYAFHDGQGRSTLNGVYPKVGNISSQPGIIHWDYVDKWIFCGS